MHYGKQPERAHKTPGGGLPLAALLIFVCLFNRLCLAGGPGKAKTAVFQMASTKYDEEAREVVDDFESLGADGEALAIALGEFTGYWFLGGNQSRLTKALLGTRALDVIERGFQEGKIVGGTSAGAAVMTTAMLTGRYHENAKNGKLDEREIARKLFEISRGFGFLDNAIVDQHFLKRARYNRLFSAVLDHPHLIGVGIDEETAALIRPDGLWEVLGASYVKIFDARHAQVIDGEKNSLDSATGIRLHLLPAGSVFDPVSGRAKLPPPATPAPAGQPAI